jgi:uncharacterized protein
MALISAFLDTSGLFAILAKPDPAHPSAVDWLGRARTAKASAVTTDYILDETATLLKSRGRPDLIPALFDFISPSSALRVEWIDRDRFETARQFLLRHNDHDYSFTDCTSFVVMRELHVTDALTTDRHFREACFTPLLPVI